MPRPVHIIVLVHGLWGDVTHLQSMEDVLLESFGGQASSSPTDGASSSSSTLNGGEASLPDVDVRILRVKGNQNDKTYDGIDINASRVVEELDAEIARLEQEEGLEVKYLSLSGYSLGGLVARYALGILYSRPTFFEHHKPLCFATFASPWIGSLRYATLFNRLFTIVGSRFISRSGEQLFCVDKEQLVARLARKDDVFYKALELFERVDVYASAQNDRTVPFPSGAFSEVDPFEDWEGLIVETEEDAPILKSWRRPTAGEASSSTLTSNEVKRNGHSPDAKTRPAVKPPKRHRLPPFLRFRFPLNILFYCVLPLLLPLALSLVLYRFGRESRRSRKRLEGADSESLWARIREVEQALETELEDGFARVEADDAGTPVLSAKGQPVSGLRLTESQRAMIRSLDQLPNLEKHFAWMPDSFNSHAAIIGRDPIKFPDHGKGKLIIRHWTKRMLLKPERKGLVEL